MKERRAQGLERQVRRVRQRLVHLGQASNRYAWLRLAVFVAGAAISGLLFYLAGFWPAALAGLVTLLLFGLAVYVHRRVETSRTRHQVWLQLKLAQLARMRLDWENLPGAPWQSPRYDHPFEADLDLVGPHSLHRLLDTPVSAGGSALLRAWLTTPAPDPAEITRRQRLVAELAPRSLFRDKLRLNGIAAAGAQKMWEADRLLNWLDEPSHEPVLRLGLILSTLFVVLNLGLLGLARAGLTPPWWQFTVLLYFALLILASTRLTGETFHEAAALQEALRQVSAVFRQLETFSYIRTPHLKTLCTPFLDSHARPSRHLGAVNLVVTAAGLRQNPLVWLLLNAVTPWDFYVAWRLSRLKARLAGLAPAWLATWAELEALSALANLAYLNPAYTLPALDVATEGEGPIFQAEALGHPLIPEPERVCNDFSLGRLGEIAIITGSNMAGKSTFLRTVGVNLALAYAGGPVNARAMVTRPFRLFTCIKVTDSVTDGISYFYAEVKRLKRLLVALEDETGLPLFFFIDEIFRGTNNRERFLGSRAYVQALVGKHGTGLISTHDLELARLAEQLPQVQNYHFRDSFSDGRMIFDYSLQPGPCPTTNALKIMQLEGLPVADPVT